ncbi:MAG: CbiX/SirB N-terminal domain-containing protein [Pirellulales bacterium]
MSEIQPDKCGIIIVDHGSRRAESNAMLLEVVKLYRQQSGYTIIEPAHMELAEPSIQTAFDRCAEQGAELVIVHPYFLLPGRHWSQDIPRLSATAAAKHAHLKHLVTAPLGIHPKMSEIINDRIQTCLAQCTEHATPCELCADDEENRCRLL